MNVSLVQVLPGLLDQRLPAHILSGLLVVVGVRVVQVLVDGLDGDGLLACAPSPFVAAVVTLGAAARAAGTGLDPVPIVSLKQDYAQIRELHVA